MTGRGLAHSSRGFVSGSGLGTAYERGRAQAGVDGSNQALEFRGGLNDLELLLGENPLHFVELENFPHELKPGTFFGVHRKRIVALPVPVQRTFSNPD